MQLEEILKEAESIILDRYSLRLEKSLLKCYSPDNWQKFSQANNINSEAEGWYCPYSAYVRTDSPVLLSNIFHELHGHGLFTEHSAMGRDVLTEEYLDAQDPQWGFCKQRRGDYEGFALLTEAMLCEETGNKVVWGLKQKRLPEHYVQLFEYFKQKQRDMTELGIIGQLGFPKHYTDEQVVEVMKKYYGPRIKKVQCIILYGSQKPKSDIDLFVVSKEGGRDFYNGWLDVYELNKEEFDYRVNMLDISVTDPLFTGKVIYGNKMEAVKQQILRAQITPNIIEYNIRKVEHLRSCLPYFQRNDQRLARICQGYIKSFGRSVEYLKQGEKLLRNNEGSSWRCMRDLRG